MDARKASAQAVQPFRPRRRTSRVSFDGNPILAAIAALWLTLAGGVAMAGPVTTPHVTTELAAQTAGAAPGSTLYVAVILTAEKGWHTYWRNPGDAGEATKIAWTLPPGWRAGGDRLACARAVPCAGGADHELRLRGPGGAGGPHRDPGHGRAGRQRQPRRQCGLSGVRAGVRAGQRQGEPRRADRRRRSRRGPGLGQDHRRHSGRRA